MKTIKVFICAVFAAVIFTISASAEEAKFTYFTDTETGTIHISGIVGDKAPETVVFPTAINGVKVTEINNLKIINEYGDGQFKPFDLKGAKHVVIPEGIESIGNEMFTGTNNLETVKLPKSITVLPSFCFAGAEKLHSINLEYIKAVSSFSFAGCSSLREVNLINATKVGTDAFVDTINLTIYAMEDSAAHKYATTNNIKFQKLSGFEKKAIMLYDLGLMKGTGVSPYGRRLFDLDRTPTRAEAVTMLVRFLGRETEALGKTKKHPFTDVPKWADAYVAYAYECGLTNGIAEKTFGSDMPCTPEMYLTFMLRALGYSSSGQKPDFSYEDPWMFACERGITPRQMNTSPFYRSEMVDMSYLSLTAKCKNTKRPLYVDMIDRGLFTEDEYEYWTK